MDNQRAKLRLEVDKLRKEAVTKSGFPYKKLILNIISKIRLKNSKWRY